MRRVNLPAIHAATRPIAARAIATATTNGTWRRDAAADAAERDAGRHERDDLAVRGHRHDRAQRRPERADRLLGERLSAQGGFDRAEVRPADLGGIAMGEADAVRRHDRHEVDRRLVHDPLGDRLQGGRRAGIRPRRDGGGDVGHLGDRPRDRERHRLGLGALGRLGLEAREAPTSRRGDHDDGAEEREEDAGCRARSASDAMRLLASRPIRPQPVASGIRRPEYSQDGRRLRSPRTTKFHSPSEAKMALQIPNTQSFKLPGYNWRRGKTSWDKHTWLYVSVIIAVVLGATIGLIWPEVGVALEPIGKGFVALIKMMIAPIIFCTIVVGVGSIAKAATVGKIGGLALLYFMIMTTFALAIGLVVGNIIHPGEGLEHDELDLRRDRHRGQDDARSSSSASSRRRSSPPSPARACCRCCSSPCSSGFALQQMGAEGRADHERGQEPAGAGVPHPRDDPVARPARRVRRDRRRRRARPGSRRS